MVIDKSIKHFNKTIISVADLSIIDQHVFLHNIFLIRQLDVCSYFHDQEHSQPAREVPGTSPEGHLKVLASGTSRGLPGDSQGTNKKIDNLMKNVFFRCNSSCFTHLLLLFTGKTNMQKF